MTELTPDPPQEPVPPVASPSTAGGAPPSPDARAARPDPEASVTPRERLLHEALVGSSIRAVALAVGLIPLALVIMASAGASGAIILLGAFVVGAPLFFLERRDQGWPLVLLRAGLGGGIGIGALLASVRWMAAISADPGTALGRYHADLFEVLPQLLGLALLAAITAPVWGLPLLVRACTERPGPQVAAGALLAIALLSPVLAIEDRVDGSFAAAVVASLVSGALAALLVCEADARLARLDPAAPLPAEVDPSTRFATWALLATSVLGLLCLIAHQPPRRGAESSAIGSLKAMTTAQAMFQQQDKDLDQEQDYAGNLGDLRDHGQLLDDRLANGVKNGYLFRISRPADDARQGLWVAAADPILGAADGRRFWANQSGQIFYTASKEPAVPVDPWGSSPPGWRVIGR